MRVAVVLLALLAPLSAWLPPAASAQETLVLEPGPAVLRIELVDGSTLIGRVRSTEGDLVVVETEAGARVEVTRSRIASVAPAGEGPPEPRWPAADARDRLFAGPTGRTLPARSGYVGVLELFFPNITYGVTDRVQVGGGLPVLPELALETVYLTGKLGLLQTPLASISIGAVTFLAAEGGGTTIGAVYGAGTFGDERGGVTVGAGYPFFATGDDSGFADEAVFLVGGDWRVARNASLLTENYFVPSEGGAALGGGVRLYGDRLAVDLGLGAVYDASDFVCCLPLFNLTYAFGGGDR